jgi:DNA topoisomerase-1
MGRPQLAEFVDVRCPKSGRPMVRRTGRFGPFIVTYLEKGEDQDLGMILNIDKKGHVVAPSPRPLVTELPCPTCQSPLNLRSGVRGPWLGCSRFPKCRGRGKWAELAEAEQKRLESALATLDRENPTPIICRLDGTPLTGKDGKPLKDAPTVDALVLDHDPREAASTGAAGTGR